MSDVESDPRPTFIPDDLTCLGCGYNLRTLQESGNCPECGLSIARSLTAALSRADEPTLKQLRHVVDTLAGLPIIFLLSFVPVLVLMIVPVFSPWTLWGLPVCTGQFCLLLYSIYGAGFIRLAKAFLPPAEHRWDLTLWSNTIFVMIITAPTLLLTTKPMFFLSVGTAAVCGAALLLRAVMLTASRLAARVDRLDIFRLAKTTVILALILMIPTVMINLLMIGRRAGQLPWFQPISAGGRFHRDLLIATLVLTGITAFTASLVMFRMRRLIDFITPANQGAAHKK